MKTINLKLRAPLLAAATRLVTQAQSLLLAFALLLPAPGFAVPASAPGNTVLDAPLGDRTAREQRLTQTLAAIGDVRKTLDRAQFDIEALLESLDYDPDALIEFVREKIRFEPYEGLLRGAQGTLMSQAGNALDQALLLAVLLEEAGIDVRLAHSKLNDEQALLLVRSLRGQATPAPAGQVSDLRSSLEKIARAAAVDDAFIDAMMQSIDQAKEPQEQTIWASAKVGRDYLQVHLNKADIALEPANAEPQLAKQSNSYFWVEYKDAAASPWQRVHVIPAGDVFDEQALSVSEYLTQTIPEHLQHRLRLTAKLERQVGGKSEVVNLMPPWERPVANMTGTRLTFANQPNGIRTLNDLDDLSMVEARTSFLVPTLNGVPAPGAQAFDLRGRTIPLSTLELDGYGAADVFQTVGNATLAAADALSELSSGRPKAQASSSAMSLQRVWLEYVSIHPNGTERVDERTIWLAPEAMTPAAPTMLWELATPHGIGVATLRYPASYLVDAELARLLSLEPLLRWVLAAQHASAEQPAPAPPKLEPAWSGLPELSYISQFDIGIDPDADRLLAYRAEPTIVVTRHGLRNAQEGTAGFADVDIVHNRRMVLRTNDAAIQTDPLQAVRLGTWETLIEQAELEKRLPFLFVNAPDVVISANRMYQEPQGKGHAPILLHSLDDLSALPQDSMEDATRLALKQDLQRGYVVLTEKPDNTQPLVWWRVDPATGEALGRGMDGRGQTLAETTNILTLISVKTSMVVGTTLCAAQKNACNFAECLASAAITTGIGLSVGAWLGGAFGAAAGSILGQVVDRASHGFNPLPLCYNDL